MPDLRVLSLGAGVQSSTLALLAAAGEYYRPDAAIFADTRWEPKAVYRHLDWLEAQLPFPIYRVSAGDIRQGIIEDMNPSGTWISIPWHLTLENGEGTIGKRQCTNLYKLTPITLKIRELLGKTGHAYIRPGAVEVWLGISRDEAHRMKPAPQQFVHRTYPLIELGMSRTDCLSWLHRHGYPTPPKSSCCGCPLHDNSYWRHMRKNWPEEWADAVAIDEALRQDGRKEYMHWSRKPLAEADLGEDPRQLDLWGAECEGHCNT